MCIRDRLVKHHLGGTLSHIETHPEHEVVLLGILAEPALLILSSRIILLLPLFGPWRILHRLLSVLSWSLGCSLGRFGGALLAFGCLFQCEVSFHKLDRSFGILGTAASKGFKVGGGHDLTSLSLNLEALLATVLQIRFPYQSASQPIACLLYTSPSPRDS
eukprot:TRINITY_DN37029_c0_g1_i1.p1 TRINITY_DN37029_c0_g1~~TRINITY_DN37029_c0_g1_i1.p1  ORF type:complete len:161 (+),score=19.39 TRINITY_DN37029_c0_g1_i1:108-590(+)